MKIRFINTTTLLPVDEKLEEVFSNTIRPDYLEAIKIPRHNYGNRSCVDVFFVSKSELDSECSQMIPDEDLGEMGGFDLLGVYIKNHFDLNRNIIKISPEKIMEACSLFKHKHAVKRPIVELYPTLLVAVVIHELAHWIMDDDSHPNSDLMPWGWLAVNRMEDDPTFSISSCHHRYSKNTRPLGKWEFHFIEESLANAFVLKQKLSKQDLTFLKAFVDAQPQGYKQGGLWSGNLTKTLETAMNWARFKKEVNFSRWDFVFQEPVNPISNLGQLVTGFQSGIAVSSVDFMNDFYVHLARRASVWQDYFEQKLPEWDERLNGTFGVLELVTWLGRLDKKLYLKCLKQWASNGSFRAIDELNEILAEKAMARGQYEKALKHQLIRLPIQEKLEIRMQGFNPEKIDNTLKENGLEGRKNKINKCISDIKALISKSA